jgi:hypothetical protein
MMKTMYSVQMNSILHQPAITVLSSSPPLATALPNRTYIWFSFIGKKIMFSGVTKNVFQYLFLLNGAFSICEVCITFFENLHKETCFCIVDSGFFNCSK